MIKVDSSFYYTDYGGILISENEIEAALDKATYDVCNLLNKVRRITAFQERLVKLAICAMADENLLNNNGISGLTSFSLGDMSISVDNTKNKRMPDSVKRYLLRTGLINRCL